MRFIDSTTPSVVDTDQPAKATGRIWSCSTSTVCRPSGSFAGSEDQMTTPEQKKWTEPSQDAAPAEANDRRLPAVRPSPASPAPRPSRHIWIWIAGLVMAGGAGLGHFLQPWASGPVEVAVETVTLAPVTRVLAVNGRIAALHSVDVLAHRQPRPRLGHAGNGPDRRDQPRSGHDLPDLDP